MRIWLGIEFLFRLLSRIQSCMKVSEIHYTHSNSYVRVFLVTNINTSSKLSQGGKVVPRSHNKVQNAPDSPYFSAPLPPSAGNP